MKHYFTLLTSEDTTLASENHHENFMSHWKSSYFIHTSYSAQSKNAMCISNYMQATFFYFEKFLKQLEKLKVVSTM